MKSAGELILTQRVSRPDYFNTYVYPLKSGLTMLSGANLTSICPFHNDTDPSFRYFPESHSFYCFGRCESHQGISTKGDVITLHQLTQLVFHNRYIDRITAYRELCMLYKFTDILNAAGTVSAKGSIYKSVTSQIYKSKEKATSENTNTETGPKALISKYLNDLKKPLPAPAVLSFGWYQKENRRLISILKTNPCNSHAIKELADLDMLIGLKQKEVL